MLHDEMFLTKGVFQSQVSMAGLQAMTDRFFLESELMLMDNLSDVNINSSRLDYMWQVRVYAVLCMISLWHL